MEIKHILYPIMDPKKPKEIKYIETNDNGNNIENLMKCSKAVLRRNFIAMTIYIKKKQV